MAEWPQPTTEAGRRLLSRLHDRMMNLGGPEVAGADWADTEAALPRIEAEARAAAVAAFRNLQDNAALAIYAFDQYSGKKAGIGAHLGIDALRAALAESALSDPEGTR